MKKNLSKRIFTSIVLSTILLICLLFDYFHYFHKYLWLLLLIIASIISFFEFKKLIKKIWKKKQAPIYFMSLISFFYLLFFTYTAFNMGKHEPTMLYVLLVCILSDIGGYAIGRSVGGKKLTKISPNKTISGSIGSFLFSLIPLIFIFLIYEMSNRNIYILIFMTLILSFMCQAGDLIISYFKRKAKVKDTGTILPGHGGLLDRIDGIIFAIPGFFILDKIFF